MQKIGIGLIGMLLIVPMIINHKISKSCNDAVRVIGSEYYCANILGSILGEGSNGIAFLVRKNITNEEFVLKVSELELNKKNELQPDLYEQVQGGTYIVHRYAKVIENNKMYEILEYGKKGSLDKYGAQFDYKRDQRDILNIFSKIVEGIIFMHSRDVIHADIKTENIIINNSGEPRIIDFDIAVKSKEVNFCRGTPEYMAPEILDNFSKKQIMFNEKQDIWSLGITLYSMLYGMSPFELENYKGYRMKFGKENIEAVKKFTHKGRFYVKKGTSVEIIQILLMFLKINPHDRIDLKTILEKIKETLSVENWTYIAENHEIEFSTIIYKPERVTSNELNTQSTSGKVILCIVIVIPFTILAAFTVYYYTWRKKMLIDG